MYIYIHSSYLNSYVVLTPDAMLQATTTCMMSKHHHPSMPKLASICTYVVCIVYIRYTFSSNHNLHKSSCRLCFWAQDPLINTFY